MREAVQQYWDFFAILNLFDQTNKVSNIDGNLKIQKLSFIFELKGQEKGFKSAHYRFFRYNNGPYSRFLANDVLELKEKGFITRNSNQITRRGEFLSEFIKLNAPIKGANQKALEISDEVVKEYGKYSGPQLTNIVYKMVVPVVDLENKLMKVRDIAACTDILDPIRNQNAEDVVLPDDLVSDLKEEFQIPPDRLNPNNPEVRAQAVRALEEAIHRGE